jgi:retron-type reverse transcriptase
MTSDHLDLCVEERIMTSVLTPVLGVDPSELGPIASLYHHFEVKPRKKARKTRTIASPDVRLKTVQRTILDKILSQVAPHSAATAFFSGRSIAENARAHHHCKYLLKTDISNFFPSISSDLIGNVLSHYFPHLSDDARKEVVHLTTLNGYLPQGAPTSPHLANLVLKDFDRKISNLCSKLDAVYTRYADDICVSRSCNSVMSSQEDTSALDIVSDYIRLSLNELGLKTHPHKTRLFGPKDRKIVTGLDVSADTIRPTRAFRKKSAALVRMCLKYPTKMKSHRQRVRGYLAFWESVCPKDQEMLDLKNLIKILDKHGWKETPPQLRISIGDELPPEISLF